MKPIRSLFTILMISAVAASAQEVYQPAVSGVVQPDKGLVRIILQVDEGYHITDLKNNFFTVELEANEHASIVRREFPAGVPDGDEMVFRGRVEVKAFLALKKPLTAPVNLAFTVLYQICQERPEALCFAPDSQKVSLTIAPGFAGSRTAAPPAGRRRGLIGRLQDLLQRRGGIGQTLLAAALIMLLGFLTSLTPCVYPVIPIIMGYVGGRSQGKRGRAFFLSLFFVLGLALVYSVLGVAAALAGSMLGVALQKPAVVIVIAAIFILMGLSMAGLFTIRPPASLSARVGRGGKNDWLSSLLLGGVAALVAAPCAGPVIISVLTWISRTRDLFLGFGFMLAFSLGMGIIFLLVGTFTGLIASLPRGGRWMEGVKYFFAAVMIGVGVHFLATVSPVWLKMVFWGVLLAVLAVLLEPFSSPTGAGLARKLRQALALLLLVAGIFLVWHGLEQRFFPAPATAARLAPDRRLPWLGSLDEALAKAGKENRRVMIDTYADWCVACKELEEKTYAQAEVQRALADFILVKLDFTDDKSVENKALAKRLRIIGNPTVIFLEADGTELSRFSGFVSAGDFLEIVKALPPR